jgi:hypothetical protein
LSVRTLPRKSKTFREPDAAPNWWLHVWNNVLLVEGGQVNVFDNALYNR